MNGAPEWSGHLIYTNMSTTRQDFVVPAGFIQIKDDNGGEYSTFHDNGLFDRSAVGSARVIVEAGSYFEANSSSPDLATDGNVFVYVQRIRHYRTPVGDSPESRRYDAAGRRCCPNLAGAKAVPAPTSGASTNTESKRNQLTSRGLPSANFPQLESLTLSEQGTRSQSEITSTFPNPSEADALFSQWGWSGSNYEVFVAPDGCYGRMGSTKLILGSTSWPVPGKRSKH